MRRAPAAAGIATLLVLGVVALVGWGASAGPPSLVTLPQSARSDGVRTEPPAPSSTANPVPGKEGQPRKTGPWLPGLLLILGATLLGGAFVVVLIGYAVVWLARRDRSVRVTPTHREARGLAPDFPQLGSESELAEAMSRGLEELSSRDPNAITRCWVRLETEAARAGIERRPSDTSADFVGRLLQHVGSRQEAVAELAGLYREARYSDHPMGDAARDRAAALLAELLGDLRVAS